MSNDLGYDQIDCWVYFHWIYIYVYTHTHKHVYFKDAFDICNKLAQNQRQVLTTAIAYPANPKPQKVLQLLRHIHYDYMYKVQLIWEF